MNSFGTSKRERSNYILRFLSGNQKQQLISLMKDEYTEKFTDYNWTLNQRLDNNYDESTNFGLTISFNNVLHKKQYRKYFKMFCEKEISAENINCWELIERYKTETIIEKRIKIAKEIYQNYIARDSEYELNISESLAEKLYEKIYSTSSLPVNFFDELQSIIFKIMTDTYSRFIQSDIFQQMINNTVFIDEDDFEAQEKKVITLEKNKKTPQGSKLKGKLASLLNFKNQ